MGVSSNSLSQPRDTPSIHLATFVRFSGDVAEKAVHRGACRAWPQATAEKMSRNAEKSPCYELVGLVSVCRVGQLDGEDSLGEFRYGSAALTACDALRRACDPSADRWIGRLTRPGWGRIDFLLNQKQKPTLYRMQTALTASSYHRVSRFMVGSGLFFRRDGSQAS